MAVGFWPCLNSVLPPELKVPVAGSYSSADCVTKPTINTFPLFNKVAVWSRRMVDMSPVFVHIPSPQMSVGRASVLS